MGEYQASASTVAYAQAAAKATNVRHICNSYLQRQINKPEAEPWQPQHSFYCLSI